MSEAFRIVKLIIFENGARRIIKPVGPLFLISSYCAISHLVGHVEKRFLAFWKVECILYEL